MTRFLKYCALFFFPIIVACCAVLLLPLDKRFAYSFVKGECSGHASWLHDRIHEHDRPIDIAFVGSSVGWGAFDDRSLSELLSDSLSREVHVANLSFCRPGLNLRALIIEDIIRAKKPKQIVLELRPDPSMGGHPVYGFLARTENILCPPTRLYQAYPPDLKKALVVRWEQIRQHLYPKVQYQPELKVHGIGVDPKLADQEFMKGVQQKRLKENPFPKQTLQERIHFHVYWKSLEHIARLCEKNDVRFSLCFMNNIGRSSGVPRFESQLTRLAEIWYPPDSISQNPAFYSDIVHYNQEGMNALTPFLAEKLLEAERTAN